MSSTLLTLDNAALKAENSLVRAAHEAESEFCKEIFEVSRKQMERALVIIEKLTAQLRNIRDDLGRVTLERDEAQAAYQEAREEIDALKTCLTLTHTDLLHREEDIRELSQDLDNQMALVRSLQESKPRCPDLMRAKVIEWVSECMMCGAMHNLTIDRVMPGGPYTWDNVQCLCQPCNSAKGNRTGEGWDKRILPRYADFVKKCQEEQRRGTDQGDLF